MATNSHHNQKRLLHELLQDDQEPFLLHAYISDRRRQIVRTCPKPPPSSAAIKKRKPISQHIIPHNSKPARSSSCFFSFAAAASSPAADPRKSPLYFGKRSPLTASPKTASFLLEAALRISRNTQPRGGSNRGTGIFGSLVKRLTNGGRKNKTKKTDAVKAKSVKDCSPVDVVGRRTRSKLSPSTLSGPSWTESSSSLSDDEDEFDNEMFEFAVYEDKRYCDSPFHFVLQPHDGSRTPDFSSPAASPIRLKAEGNENNKDGESLKKCQIQKQQSKTDDADAEEKEQCSPVSVLDPPFDDEEDDDPTEDGGFDDLDCSFAFVQRTKQHLLHKLCRFEKLAELDPIELEKLMLDHEQEGEEETTTTTERKRSHEIDEFVMNELSASSFQCSRNNKIPRDMKMLVSDLIDEEESYRQETHQSHNDAIKGHQVVAKRVCKRFESWKEVESNTIDMMVEQDFDRSQGEWRRKQDGVDGIAMDIEVAIFGLLVEELSEESLKG